MADTKISALTDGSPLQSTDAIPVARSGANRRVSITLPTGAIVGTTDSQTLTNKTLTTAVLGSSTATTQSAGDSSTKVATTAFVQGAVGTVVQDTATGNGSTTVFTLSSAPVCNLAVVTVNGLVQTKTTDYSISGTTLTFVSAPANSSAIQVYYGSPPAGGGGSGTVTSIAMSVPAFLSVAGSPITSSGTLAVTLSGTALPAANGGTGLTALGTGVATFLGTPSSANLASAVTDETGSGALVFATSPTLVTPVLGTPTSGTLTNCTADGTNLIGYRGAPQLSKSADYTFVLGDAGFSLLHPVGDNNARAFTIPANGSVAFPIGTILEFINMAAASCTIPITTDTLTLLPAGTTGTRTLAQYGRASAEKITSTSWVISGNSALT